jgi:hypothetical protein
MGQDQRDFQINKKGEVRLTGPAHDHEAPHLKRGAADRGERRQAGLETGRTKHEGYQIDCMIGQGAGNRGRS